MNAVRTPSVRVHVCACPGCGRTIPSDLAFCMTHWRALPADLRSAVNSAYRLEDKRAYVNAMRDAINFYCKGARA